MAVTPNFLRFRRKIFSKFRRRFRMKKPFFTEPLAAAYGITEQIEITNDTKVAVIGDGKLGILCALSLALKSENLDIDWKT